MLEQDLFFLENCWNSKIEYSNIVSFILAVDALMANDNCEFPQFN